MLENPEDPNTDSADESVDERAADTEVEDQDGGWRGEADDGALEAEVVELEPAVVRELRAEVAALSDENDDLQRQLNELTERLRAVSAAYQKQQEEVTATRERLERQAVVKEELRRGEVVSSLFEPVENLRRSIDFARKGASPDDTAKGLDLVLKEFMGAFSALGLEEVPGRGARFDPNIHEALTTAPVVDAALDQTVIDVFSAGFRIGSRLIRPAKVIVGAYTAPIAEA